MGAITLVRKILGALLMLAAVVVWITFDYSAPGLFGVVQVLNWLIVVVLAASGWFLLTLGRKPKIK